MRLGKSGAGALVTQVRERAFKNEPEKAQVTDAELMGGSVYDYGRRDSYKTEHDGGTDIKYGRFLDELGWEFCQEGRRRQDMIRFGIFTTKAWFSHDKSDETKNLYPIPNKVLLTNSNLKQNPLSSSIHPHIVTTASHCSNGWLYRWHIQIYPNGTHHPHPTDQ